MLSAEQRTMNARRAANARWRREGDRAAATLSARQTFLKGLERRVDPRRELTSEERAARARSELIVHMARLGRRA